MYCPKCNGDTHTTDSRPTETSHRRRRECLNCGFRFTTYEKILGDNYSEIDVIYAAKIKAKLIDAIDMAFEVVPNADNHD